MNQESTNFTSLATKQVVEKTIKNLTENGINAELVETAQQAKEKVLRLIPKGAEVMTMTSITLEQTGLSQALNSSDYLSIKQKLMGMDRATQNQLMQQIGSAPEWTVGSVHAVTQDGKVIIVSNTGSQIPAYAYGSAHVVWVVSTKKIVANIDAALERVDKHIVPQETQRARQAYGLPDTWNTYVSKLLIINREVTPNRIHLVFVNEDLGF